MKSKSKKAKSTQAQVRSLLTKFNFGRYLLQVESETNKVTWPNRPQVLRLTVIVVLVSAFVGAYVGGLDALFTALMGTIINLAN